MRLAAKAPRNELEWSILDVEQDEWERRLAELGVAAAANGIPVYPAAALAVNEEVRAVPSARNVRRALPAVVFLVVFGSLAGGLAGYGVWRRAEEGIVRMEGDVANAVKVENLQENGRTQAPVVDESVQTVEFLGDAAQAMLLVTRTLASGELLMQPELRFYVQTPKGWERSTPIAGFWGPTETLDTTHLHFVFGRRDRTVVEQVAPGIEAVYATLRRATGQDLPGAGQLSIEIVPEVFALSLQPGARHIRMTSPALYPASEQEQAGILGRLLRLELSHQLMAASAQKTAAKPQWQPLVHGLGAWLAYGGDLPFAADGEVAALRRLLLRLPHNVWQLDDLLGDRVHYDALSEPILAFTLIGDPEQQKQQEAAAEQLVGYIAATYGIDALPRLLHGFAQYEDWEELAPDALGVSAVELEEGWHTAMYKGAPLRTFR